MRAALVTHDPDSPDSRQLAEALARHADEVAVWQPHELTLWCDHTGPTALWRGEPVAVDLAVPRCALLHPGLAPALDALSAAGAAVVNSTASAALAGDKLASAAALARAGVPFVPTLGASTGHGVPVVLPGYGDDRQLVVKPALGGGGVGVRSYPGTTEVAAHLARRCDELPFDDTEQAVAYARHYVVQPHLACFGDLRVFVAGGRAVATVLRTPADPSDFRTNGAFGAHCQVVDDPAAGALAVAAVSALGLDYAGVDVVDDGTGPRVLEVNGWPGLDRTSEVAGVDLADEVARLAVSRGAGPAPATHTSLDERDWRTAEVVGLGTGPVRVRRGAPLVFSAPHDAWQVRNGVRKWPEVSTGLLAWRLAALTGGTALASMDDQTGDPNFDPAHPYRDLAARLAAGGALVDLHKMRARGVDICVGLGVRHDLSMPLADVLARALARHGLTVSWNWPFNAERPETVTAAMHAAGIPALQVELSGALFDRDGRADPRLLSALDEVALGLAGRSQARA